ncbi:MAG: type II toxin-antitoxin system VapC family toxin [Chloroflexi bacterium]|nr:type II toxin-antitoxin system VapC family toxin [Chloroflexota bacterium]
MAIVDAICLDTGPLIAYLRGRHPGAKAVKHVVKECACYVSAITVHELLFGVARAKKQIGENVLLKTLTTLPLDEAVSRRAALLHADLISQNNDIGIKDTFIAATCLEHSLPILTLNKRHFSRVPDLKLLTPENIPE